MNSPVTREQIRAAREAAGLTLREAAELVYITTRGWQHYEAGTREMPLAYFELFRIKVAMRGRIAA
jgi:transcriptional regulator with XRE-family HTH domain